MSSSSSIDVRWKSYIAAILMTLNACGDGSTTNPAVGTITSVPIGSVNPTTDPVTTPAPSEVIVVTLLHLNDLHAHLTPHADSTGSTMAKRKSSTQVA